MKTWIAIIGLIVIAGAAFFLWNPAPAGTGDASEGVKDVSAYSVAADGTYAVQTDKSTITWAGQKPFIDGYINTGTFEITEGSVGIADDSANGSFTIDMNTLSVTETAKKPGQESALESHLKGERWFNVATFPTATFAITSVAPREDSDTTFVYDVTGDLTMKGETHELTFPATIYQDEEGLLHASADFEFDRTRWGITAGSASFFDNLADNAVADMVALSFDLVAEKQ